MNRRPARRRLRWPRRRPRSRLMRWREDWCCRRIARLRRRVRRRSWGRVRRRRWCRPRRRARAGRGCRPRRRCCRPVDAVLVAVRVRVGVRADPPVAAVRVGARLDRPLVVDAAVVVVVVIIDDRRRAGLAGHAATEVERRIVQRAGRHVARGAANPAHRRAMRCIVAALEDLPARGAAAAVVVPALPWNRKLDAADEIGRWVVATVAIRVRVRTVSFARD